MKYTLVFGSQVYKKQGVAQFLFPDMGNPYVCHSSDNKDGMRTHILPHYVFYYARTSIYVHT